MPKPLLLFAPGAGAPSSHPSIQNWKRQLSLVGRVETFDYDYMREGRKRPDRLPELITAQRQALAANRRPDEPVILIGKSMGGRIGCHVALEDKVAGVICLSYPLCGGGDPTKLRDKVLLELKTQILFVQGTRDPLCPLQLLEGVRAKMTVPSVLHVVDDGDHSLQVRKRHLATTGESQKDVDNRILKAITAFAAPLVGAM